ncbi:MAG: hypothetical protein AAF533_11680 [Acidobacteriota bacterium]
MHLMTFHRILIGTAAVVALLFAVWNLTVDAAGTGWVPKATAALSALVGVVLLVYLHSVRGKTLMPPKPPQDG